VISPNPATDKITVCLPDLLTSANSEIYIYNLQGQLIQKQNLTQNNSNISVEGFANGLYLMKVKNETDVFVARFIKE
jgi:hypothetical protein